MGVYGKGKSKNNSIIEPGRERESRSGAGHDGRSKAFVRPGERGLVVHHDPNVPRTHDGMQERASGNLARSGKPKAFHAVSVHKGMTDQQRAMAGVGGMGHATTIDGLPGSNPLNPNPVPSENSIRSGFAT
jgi:hypothetical protein